MRIQQKKKHGAQFQGNKTKARKLAFIKRESKRKRNSILPMVLFPERSLVTKEHMKSVAVLQDMMFPYLLRGE